MGASPDSVISAPIEVVAGAPRPDLPCRFRIRWRSFRLPISLGSHQILLLYSATDWMQDTWTALTLTGTTPYVCVRVQILASSALACFMHRLESFLNVRCASIETPCQRVTALWNLMNPFPTLIVAVMCGRMCFLWACLRVNNAALIVAVFNCSRCLHAHSMRFTVHRISLVAI